MHVLDLDNNFLPLCFQNLSLSHESLNTSFNIIPQCDLVFHPTRKTANIGFFVAMTLTQQSSGETVLYASTTLKKVLVCHPSSVYNPS